jgi:hypothetical protein
MLPGVSRANRAEGDSWASDLNSCDSRGRDPLGREPGELLWDDPEGYNYGAFLRARQRETSPMMWAALYQQRPTPEEGDFFKAAWFKPYEHCRRARV